LLNQWGVERLKADLRANAQHYNQSYFGTTNELCGTEACMAGMCFMRQLGFSAFTAKVTAVQKGNASWIRFSVDCVDSAAQQMGLELLGASDYYAIHHNGGGMPPIFGDAENWPPDLATAYRIAKAKHDHPAMVEVACAALDRMDVHGFIHVNIDI
jgi:hypothetical protein